MSSDTERPGMIILLNICSFLMSNDSRLSCHTISPERCIWAYLWVNLAFTKIIELIVLILGVVI